MKLRVLLSLLIVCFCLSGYSQTGSLYFVNGTAQSVSICENSSNYVLDNYLVTYDKTTGNLLTYSIKSIPSHGTLHGFPGSGGSNGGVFAPSGFYYTPTSSYSGKDAFVIQVADGSTVATTTFTITINTLPTVGAIVGNTISCASGTHTLYDPTANGVWSSNNTVVATIDSLTGVVTPGTAGTATIGYTVTNTTTGCSNTSTTAFIVSGAPVVNGIGVTGATTICAGSTTIYTDGTSAPSGGSAVWSSGNTAVATIDSITGVVTGVSAGNATISYIVTNQYGCNRTVTRGVTVTAAPVADSIGYTTKNVCVGSTIVLTNATPGGGGITRAWSSSNGNATISRGITGVGSENVLGNTPGTDSIYFTVTSGGCTATASLLVTVNPLPVLSAISGGTTTCQFNTVQLSDTTPKGTWTSSKTAVATISSTGLLSALTAGTTNITYAVTSAAGCSSSVTSGFTVYAAAAVNPIVGTNSICIGSSTTLTDNTIGGSWSISNSKYATIDNTGLLTGKAAGKDTVFYSYTTAGGCTQVASFPITVAASVVVAPITGSSSVCLNSTTQLKDATIDPTATWSSSDQTIAAVDNNGNITTVQPGVVTIQYSVGSGSCIGTALKNFIVYALPNVDNNSITDTSLCTGSSVKLTNDSLGGVWSTSSASASVDTSGLVTAVSSGSSVITYSITDKNGCYNAASSTIAVNTTPAAFTITGSNSTCAGGVISYTTSLTNSVTATWLSSNTSVATLTNSGKTLSNSLIASKINTGTTTVYCTANNGQCTRTDSIVVAVTKALVVAPIVGNTNLCMGSNSTFTDSTTNGTITWTVSSGTGSANITNGVVTPVTAGTATVNYSINEGNGCSGSVTKTIVINNLPTVGAIVTPNPATVCAGSTITLSDTTQGGVWKSGNTAAAIIDSTGVVTGLVGTRGAGTNVTITYTYTSPVGCTSNKTATITVNTGAGATANTGVASLCAGSNYTFTNVTTGGTWSSDNTAVAIVNSSTGNVTAVSAGSAVIQYTTIGFGRCPSVANSNLTVVALPKIVASTGDSVLCVGQNSQLFNASVIPTGGTYQWSSSNTSIATVSATGLVTAVGSGKVSIYYTVINPKISVSTCYSTATTNFVVNANPTVPAISGSGSTLCVGSSLTLTDATSGGTWGVNDTTIATITPTTGIVTGVSGGNIIVTYSVADPVTGCTSTEFGNGTIIGLPTVGAILGNNALCIGSTSQLTNSTTQGVWSSSNVGVAKVSTSGLVTPVSAGTSVISYTYTNPTYGCKNAATDTVTVNPVPVVGPITGNASVCSGNAIALADTTVGGTWNSSNKTVATVDNSGNVTPVSFGNDTIQYTLTNPLTNCSTTALLPIKVSSTPVASFTVNKTSQCLSGNYFVFTNTSTISSGSINNVWTIDGKTFTSLNPTYSFASAGTYTIKLVVTSNAGCSDSTTQTVTVNPQSVPDFAINNNSQCLTGNSFSFTNNSSISSGSDGFTWNFGDGGTATSINATHTYTSAGTYNVQLVTTSNNGCLDSISQTVTTLANLTPSVSIKATSTSICAGTNVIFTATPTNGGTAPVYQWYKNGVAVGTNSNSYSDNALADGDSIKCILNSSYQCLTASSATSNLLVIAVAQYVTPSVSISTPTTTICSGTNVTFTASATNSGSSPSYQWTVNGSNVGTNSNTYSSSTLANGSVVTLTLTSSVACVTSRSTSSNDVTVTVNSPSSSNTLASICSGGSYLFNGTSYNLSGSYTTHLTNAAGCDSAATLVLTVKATSTSTTRASICQGSAYTFNGIGYTNAGTYTTHLTNAVGCDSAATLILTIKQTSTSTTNASICNGTSYTFNGTSYTSAGTYTAHLTNSVGCDSAATLVLTVKPTSTSTTNASICAGTSYTFNGTSYTSAGTYVAHLTNSVGCDSAATLVLTVKPTSTSTTTASICAGDTYTFNGVGYTKTGTFVSHLTNSVGCDSAASLVLTVKPTSTSTTNLSICPTSLPYSWNGLTFTGAGTQTAHLTNSVGCDSAATLVLTVKATSVSTTNISICPSALPFSWNGLTFTGAGTQTAHLTNSVGCDSAATLVLTVKATSTSTTNLSICSSALPYSWNGLTFTSAGTQTARLTNSVGCDSAATLVLTVKPTSISTTNASICAGTSYTFNGTSYTSAGTYVAHLTNSVGCDSAATLVLTVKPTSTSITTASICAGDTYTFNGVGYTKTGTYVSHLTNSVGCDSAASLVLTVKPISTSTTNLSICPTAIPFSWNGLTFTGAGTQTVHLTNSVGCDSAATLVLTVKATSVSTTNISICPSALPFSWNGLTFTGAGTQTAHLTNSVGCDSAATLILSVKSIITSTTNISICPSALPYSWNGLTFTGAGTQTAHLTSSIGCDSAATLVLTVLPTSISSSKISICPSALPYTWNGLTFTGAGTQIAHLINSVGCDSAATLVLTVLPTSTSSSKISICPSALPYSWNGLTFTGAGTQTAHLTNGVGCDSAATLVLTVLPTSTSTSKISICPSALPYSWNGLTFTAAGTQTAHLTNSVGCDSAATLVLTVLPTSTSSSKISICPSALPYTWNGLTFTGAGSQTAHLTNSVGCDSAATLVLTVLPTSTSTTDSSICPSALPFVWNGLTFTGAGTQTAHLTNSVGCDSAATLVLTVLPTSTSTTTLSICPSALPYKWNGLTFTGSGTQIAHLTNSVGCDSAATLILTVLPTSTSLTTLSICPSELPYSWNGLTFTSAGTQTAHLTNSVGCDSAATLVLTVLPTSTSTTTLSICPSALPYSWNGLTFTSAGTQTAHLTNSVGCDSAATLVLTVLPISISSSKISICPSALPYTWNGLTFTGAGTQTAHLTNSVGCDSAATLVLTVLPTSTSTTNLSICPSALPFTWNGLTFTGAGTQTAHLTNSVGCDSAATLVLTVLPTSTSTTTLSICPSALPYSWNGLTFTAAGTQTAHLTNSVGCDSAATLVLTVLPTSTSTTNLSICASALPYTWNGLTFTGAGTKTAHLTNSVGCDSAATLILAISKTSASTTNLSICSSVLPYSWNGLTFTSAGSLTAHLTNSAGCDSAATLVLTVLPTSTSTTNLSICASALPYVWNGLTFTSAGTQTAHLTNSVGCDSAATLVLTVKTATTSTTTISICAGSTYSFNGNTYDSAGTYVSHLTNSVGCDSAATLILTVKYPTSSVTKATICAGGGYNFNGNTYDSAGTYVSHLTNSVGCDSVATLLLTVNYPSSSTTTASVDSGSVYTFNGLAYDKAGTYIAHLTNSTGCDSVAKLILTVISPTSSVTVVNICSGGSYTFNGQVYTTTGVYSDKFKNAGGADSTATLSLTVNSPTSSTVTASICAGSGYSFNGTTYDSSGTYTMHLTNAAGCDSAVSLNLTVKYPTSSTTTTSICAGSSYLFNGVNYDSAGTYTAHFTNTLGCDSTAKLVLTVNYPAKSTVNQTICAGSSYLFNGTSYDSAGTYTAHLTTAAGCDSTVTLVLGVIYPSTSVTTTSICAGSSYFFNGVSYDAAGTYVAHLTNSVGCDSAATLVLTVNSPTTSVATASICAGSSYYFNGTNYDSAGTYTSHFVNALGCDSAATLILKVNYPTSSTTDSAICASSLPFSWNGLTFTAAGTQTAHLSNSTGCDSLATLVLTVNAVSTSTTDSTICASSLPFSWNGLTFTAAGTQTAHLSNSTGCDSLATLVLTVSTATSSITYDTINKGSAVTFNGTSYDTTGTYTAHLINAGGCDSTATLILTVNDIVPVSLKYFSGVHNSDGNKLSWSTATEVNSAYFVIQLSTDGKTFSALDKVAASGNKSGSNYAYLDAANASSKVYYRLQMVDKQGNIAYSNVVVITLNSGISFTVYPNPVRNIMSLRVNNDKSETVTVQVIDLLGKVLTQQQAQLNAGTNTLSLNVSSLASGSYVVVIKGESQESRHFIKY